MKANEFVKKFGWNAVKHDLSGYFKDEKIGTIQVLTHEKEYIEVNGDELKTLLKSHELVEHAGGLDSAKKQIELKDSEDNCLWCVDLKIAIADVESCMEVSSEG